MGRPQLRRADEPVTFGAYRGPGAPTAAFAVESLLDDWPPSSASTPVELRLKNACIEGDRGMTGPVPTFGAVEVLEATAAHELWAKRLAPRARDRSRAGYWPGGNEPAAAVCRVDTDGTMTVVTSAVDMTGGTRASRPSPPRRSACLEKVRVVAADVLRALRAPAAGAGDIHRRQGVQRAAEAAREKLLQAAGGARDRARRSRGRTASYGRWAHPTARSRSRTSRRRLSASAVATSRSRARRIRADQPRTLRSAHIAHVRVDRATGEELPRLRDRPGRRQGTQPPRSSRARAAAGAGDRLGAVRGTRARRGGQP